MSEIAKVDMATLPARMSDLEVDERGYVVPWFVDWLDGKPEFRAMDQRKFVRAIRERLCWVCGKRLGVHMCFVAGPMCGVNRTSSEPPCHLDCARWSAINCPFLSNPRMVRRQDEIVNNAKAAEVVAGCPITRNPGVTMLWITREYEIFYDQEKRPLLMMGAPEEVEWYREGRAATRAEVMHSVNTGLPLLRHLARQEKGGLEALQHSVDLFMKLVPGEY